MDKPGVHEKTAVAAIADLHLNSTVALCPRVVNLDDGGTYHASRTQCWLYECWLDYIAQVKALTEGYYRLTVYDGDLGELDTKRRSNQLITGNKATIQSLVLDTIAPLVDISDASVFVRGTPAHTGKSAWLEEAIGKDITNTLPAGEKIYSHWQLRRAISGVRTDISHHASMGSTPWAKRNAANVVAAKIMWLYQVEMGEKAPQLALRSHNHTYATSGDNYACQVDYLPAWTTLTEYCYRVGLENAIADIGGMVYLCDKGKFTRHKITYEPREARRVWRLAI